MRLAALVRPVPALFVILFAVSAASTRAQTADIGSRLLRDPAVRAAVDEIGRAHL